MTDTKKIGAVVLVVAVLAIGYYALTGGRAAPTWDTNPSGFVHGLAVKIDGETWYFKGPGSVEGAIDVPGHTWKQTSATEVEGKHYNVGPAMAAEKPWWATGEPYGELLFEIHGVIAPADLPEARAEDLKSKGYIHRHEFVDSAGNEHPTQLIYLKHTGVREFGFNGGPKAPKSDHQVSRGVDYNFMPNW